ncbi:MAG: biotin--[acetyl-CoA-carboxylase] ligase [Anaerolineae bacterium]|nr:biotin--[acetyl-CoA-carboxylase] ligase [Anaerolineae bacterium]
MTLTQDRLQQRLNPRPMRFYETAGSTNDLARDWLRAGGPEGAVVIADEQVAGRGRRGHGWHTPPGAALALSVILRPAVDHLPRLSLLGALAIAELCEQLGAPEVGIKWPNDVQIGGLKVSGVLPEAEWDGSRLLGVVLGMGLNVRVDFRGSELEGRAISLEDALGRRLDRTHLVGDLLERVDDWYACLGSTLFYDAWKTRLATIGHPVRIGELEGVAESVDEEGVLWVRDGAGRLHRVLAGDMVMR